MRKAETLGVLTGLILIALTGASACKKKSLAADKPLPATSVVTTNDLRIRISPNTTAAEIGVLSKGEQVKIVQRSAETVQVGKLNAYWYKVTNSSGLTGWVYGAHLAVESAEGEEQGISDKNELRLRTELPGRWDAGLPNGTLTTNYVSLWANGKIEFGTNRKATQTGKFELVFEGSIAKIQVTGIRKPMMTHIKAKIVGDTFVFNALMGDEEYRLQLSEKNPGIVLKSSEATPAPAPR